MRKRLTWAPLGLLVLCFVLPASEGCRHVYAPVTFLAESPRECLWVLPPFLAALALLVLLFLARPSLPAKRAAVWTLALALVAPLAMFLEFVRPDPNHNYEYGPPATEWGWLSLYGGLVIFIGVAMWRSLVEKDGWPSFRWALLGLAASSLHIALFTFGETFVGAIGVDCATVALVALGAWPLREKTGDA